MNMAENEVLENEVLENEDAGKVVEGKSNQIESMKAKWQEPEYKARVALGRHAKAIVKLEAELAIAEGLEEPTDEKELKVINSKIANLYKKKAAAEAKVEEASLVLGQEEVAKKFEELRNPKVKEVAEQEEDEGMPVDSGEAGEILE